MANMLEFAVSLSCITNGSFNSAFTTAAQKMTELQKKTQSLQQASGQVSKMQKMQQTLEASKLKLDAARMRVKELAAEMERTPQPTARMRKEFTRANIDAARMSETVQKQRKAIGELQKSLNDAGVNTRDYASAQQKLTEQLDRTRAAQDRLASAQSRYENLKGQLSWGNIKGDVMASMGTVMAFKQPIQTMMNFEQAMANVRAVTGAGEEEFTMLRDQALELGRTTQFSASQAANTQENLARAGLSPAEIRDMMPQVLAMAAADGMDLAQAGSIMAASLKGYNLEADQAGRIADMLSYISSNSRTDVAMAGEAFQSMSGTGQLMAIEPERLGAYIGALANRGYQGTEAATALERSLQALSAPTTEAAKTLQRFGVKTKTKGGNLRFMDDIAAELLQKTAKLGATGQIEAFKNVFGKAYGPVMQKLALEVQSGGFGEMYTGLKEKKQGSAQRQAAIRNDTLQGDLTALGSAWEGFMISVGKPLESWSRNIVQTLTQGISKVTTFIGQNKELSTWIIRGVAVFSGFKVIRTVWYYGSLLVQLPFARLGVSMAEGAAQAAMAGQKFSLFGSIAGSVFAAIKTLALAAWGVIAAHPFVAIGAAVAVAAALIYQHWDTIRETAAKCWEAVKNFAGSASQWVSDKWQAVCDWWDSLTLADIWEGVKDLAAKAYNWYTWPARKLSEWLSSTFQIPDIFASLNDFAANAIEAMKAPFIAFGEWIMDTIGKLNPFNWELPAWLGGGTPDQRRASAVRQADTATRAMNSAFGAPGFEVHATGGILTRPHLGLVAEAGPEAVIPLRNRSRGREVLTQAAGILGMTVLPVPPAGGQVRQTGAPVNNNAVSSLVSGSASSNSQPVRQTGISTVMNAAASFMNRNAGYDTLPVSTSNPVNALTNIAGSFMSNRSTAAATAMNAATSIMNGSNPVSTVMNAARSFTGERSSAASSIMNTAGSFMGGNSYALTEGSWETAASSFEDRRRSIADLSQSLRRNDDYDSYSMAVSSGYGTRASLSHLQAGRYGRQVSLSGRQEPRIPLAPYIFIVIRFALLPCIPK